MTNTRTPAQAVQEAIDPVTYSWKTVDYAHREIHDGNAYTCGTAVDLAAGGTVHLMITTPDTAKWLHLVGGAVCEAEATIRWYENPTSPTGGGTITPINRNRNSTNTSAGVVVGTVGSLTATPGSRLFGASVGSGKSAGGEVREISEWILKRNEQYILEVINQSSSAAWVSVQLDWYEHTNKE